MSCDVELILQPFRHFTYVTIHSPTLPLLHLRHSSFSSPSFASPTSQALHLIYLAELILPPYCHFIYITTHSPTLPFLHLRHSSFSNPSFVSPTSQVLHLIHLAGHPWWPVMSLSSLVVIKNPANVITNNDLWFDWRRQVQCSKHTNCERPPLWWRDSTVASHLAGRGLIPGRVNFPGWGFSSTVWQMSGKFSPHSSLDIIGHHNHKKLYITGTNDVP